MGKLLSVTATTTSEIFALLCYTFLTVICVGFLVFVSSAQRIHTVSVMMDEDTNAMYVFAKVGGITVKFQIDTGCEVISLAPGDAAKVGDAMTLQNTESDAEYADGRVMKEHDVVLSELAVGDITVRQVEATILPEGARESLLGFSFMLRYSSFGYRVKDHVLYLEE